MNFDFKITTWERVNVPDHLEQVVFNGIKDGDIHSSNSLYDFLSDNSLEDEVSSISYNVIAEVEEQVSINDNNGLSTIEVMENGEVIWGNADSKNQNRCQQKDITQVN